MDILVINPNTTATMTSKIGAAARQAASAGTHILAVSPEHGPTSIEGYFDGVFAVPGLIGELQKHQNADGCVIACFDDTGLDAARSLVGMPVVGIGEAAFHLASLVAGRFGVVTTLSRSIPVIEQNLVRYGLAARCCGVRASDVPVLELDQPGSHARARVSQEIERSIGDDGAEAIVLGCAGMADFAAALSAHHGLPVLDGVACAVRLCESLVGLGLATSKRGGYQTPRAKTFAGMFAPFSPGPEVQAASLPVGEK